MCFRRARKRARRIVNQRRQLLVMQYGPPTVVQVRNREPGPQVWISYLILSALYNYKQSLDFIISRTFLLLDFLVGVPYGSSTTPLRV